MASLKPRVKHVSLAFLGEEWQDCYLDFAALQWTDVKNLNGQETDPNKAFEAGIALLQRKFLKGQGIDESGQPLDLTADDLEQFDIETLTAITGQVGGNPDPNV